MSKERHYGAIDGLRAIACLGIVIMHIKANSDYGLEGPLSSIISSFSDFTYLFMMISAFGMCCGYYERIMAQSISISDFYSKRFRKIWPFFAVLVLLDLAISPSAEAFYGAFADLTLLFGFLPNAGSITVIGVGWFLGVIFVFYLIFPFFCYLLATKRRAWIAFGISLIYNYACSNYFEVNRRNILFSGCFFLAGGLVYLYREEIEMVCKKVKGSQWMILGSIALLALAYYASNQFTLLALLLSVAMLVYAIIYRGGYCKTASCTSSAVLAWKYTSRICSCFELERNCI